MVAELKIIDNIEKSEVLFFASSKYLTNLEISMQDFAEKNFVSLHIEKHDAKQIISFLQNHFNL